AALIALILVNKYVDHLPLDRQQKIFRREGVKISPSTINNWVKRGIECLEVLYQSLVNEIKNRGYLQADETPIKVLTSEKKGATHQGYFWVYH
ncbi:transposase, partial [uncultured Microscilla sp.]